MMPGTATPGEMEQAMSMGLDVVKFFPAEQNGGVAKLKAVAGPYTTLRWMPTGGVNTKNLMDYLSFDKIIACGGTWMVKKDLIEGENWDEIDPHLTQRGRQDHAGLRAQAHVGINCANADEAAQDRQDPVRHVRPGVQGTATPPTSPVPLWNATRLPAGAPTATSPSAPTTLDRAVYHLGLQGRAASMSPAARPTAKGNTKAIYLKDEMCRLRHPPGAEVMFYSFAQQGCKKRPELRHLRFNVFTIADKTSKRQCSIFSWQRRLLPSAS